MTVSVPPGDNWMIHVAVEQCQEGDVLVVAPDLAVGRRLLRRAARHRRWRARGVRGLVIDAGCRDVAELDAMGFPVWSRCVSAEGTVKETLGTVNVPSSAPVSWSSPVTWWSPTTTASSSCPGSGPPRCSTASRAREEKEAASRERYRAGELGLDVNAMRERLARKGLRYVDLSASDTHGSTSR